MNRRFNNRKELSRYHKISEYRDVKKKERARGHKKRITTKRSSTINIYNKGEEYFKRYSRSFYSKTIFYFIDKDVISDKFMSREIKCPSILSFTRNYNESLLFVKRVASSLFLSPHKCTIDFNKCKSLGIAPVQLLQLIFVELYEFSDKFNKDSFQKIRSNRVAVLKSKHPSANRYLFAFDLIPNLDEEDGKDGEEYLSLELSVGSKHRTSYFENLKGHVCTRVVKFINESIEGIRFSLNEKGVNQTENLVSEILNNAEDHSIINRWFVNGVSFKRTDKNDTVVEFNLCIINFGFSIYEGFELSKELNFDIFKSLEQAYKKHVRMMNKRFGIRTFSKEGMFTLYALQEGISRLKYERESRGTGTMNFIRAFINLGKMGTSDETFSPVLHVFSGHTTIRCDKDCQPYQPEGDTQYYLSLNKKEDMLELPDKEYLRQNNKYFPGTILQIRLFLSEKHFSGMVSKGS